MPSLLEFTAHLRRRLLAMGYPITDDQAREIMRSVRDEYGAQRVYIPPPHSRKDPERADAVRQASKRLPTGVAAQKAGVSASYAYRLNKQK